MKAAFVANTLDKRDSWHVNVDRLRSTGLYSIHGRLLRIDLVMVCKSFHSDVDLGSESLFEVARVVGTRSHRFRLAIPVYRSEVRRSLVDPVVSLWNSLPSWVVEVSSVEIGCRTRQWFA